VQVTINNIQYVDNISSTAKLISIPVEGQTYDYIPQNVIDEQNYTLSFRNSANVYIVPTTQPNLYINFIGRKTIVTDSDINTFLDTNFSYFIKPEPIIEDLFTLPDGQIFRCVTENSVPLPKEQYVYYVMVDGIAKEIPNYKTLEVLLEERNQTLLSVRVLTEAQCMDIPKNGMIPDKSGVWTVAMSDQTTNQILTQINQNVQSGAAIASTASTNAATQVAAVKAQAEQSKAEANAAQAVAAAAKAASEAAIAEANAAKAQAELAIQNNTKKD
jgi:hypothetical protein